MRVLDSYGDDYRASQFTIVLEVSTGLQAGWGTEAQDTTLTSSLYLPGRGQPGYRCSHSRQC